jgi:hypothetical protein
MADEIDKLEETIKLRERQKEQEKQTVAVIAEKLELLAEEAKLTEGLEEQLKLNKQIRENEILLSRQILKDNQIKLNNLLEIKKVGQELTEEQEKELKGLLDEKKEHQDIIKLMEKQANLQEEAVGAVGSFFKLTLGVRKESETLVGKLSLLKGDSIALKDTWTAIQVEARKYVNATSIADSILKKIVQSTLAVAVAQDQAVSSFNKLSGTTGEYTSLITNASMGNRRFAVSMADAGQAVGDLFTSMSSFSELNEKTQADIVNTTVQLDKLGISSSIVAKNMEIATRSLGMTAGQAVMLQKDLFDTATALRLPPAAVAEGFAQAAPQLAQHGEKMADVIKGLALESKATGIAMNELLGIVGKFNTFEGAADAAGKLNAILGGDLLNSTELLLATEEERIQMLQDTITNSGKAWHEMSRFEKMAVANAAGIQDMAQAAALFNPQMIGMSESQKDAAERARAVTTVSEQFTAIMGTMAVVITPLIEKLKSFADIILRIHDETSVAAFGGTSLITAMLGIGAAAVLLIKTLTVVTAIFGPLGGSSAAAGAGMTTAAGGVKALATAATQGAVGLLSFGAAIMMVGAGIGIAALGVAQLAGAFAQMSAGQILATSVALGVMGVTIVVLAKIMAALSPLILVSAGALLAFGGAITLIGAGVALAAAGMSLLASSLSGMDPAQILATAAAMTALSAAMVGLGAIAFIGPLVIPVAIAIGAAFMMIGSAVSGVVEKIVQFNNSLASVNFDSVVTGYARIAQEIKNIVENIESLPLTKAMTFSYLMGAPVMAALPAGAVESPAASPIVRGTPTGVNTARTERSVNRLATAGERQAAASIPSPRTTTPDATSPEVVVKPNIKLVIDGRELGRVLDSEIRERIKSREEVIGGRAIQNALGK